jgi:methionyl-tRNA formyltransferase
MRLIMFGTGPFAVPTFEAILASPHEVLALVTRPISESGKRRRSAENPTRDVGTAAGIEIFEPPSINDPQAINRLTSLSADLFVVCDYGQILARECLAAARLGGINLHGSLLPRYRGAAPINWAIYHGESVLGITVIHMSAHLDAGPCLVKAQMRIDDDDTAETVEPKLAALGVAPVMQAIEMLDQWDGQSPLGEVQDRSRATRAPRLQKSDGQIDWSRSAVEIVNQVRAFQPWPGTFATWVSENRPPMRLIIHQAVAVDSSATDESIGPGQVILVDSQRLLVQTGGGALALETVQPAGKRPMPVADFLRGHQPAIGDHFDGSG